MTHDPIAQGELEEPRVYIVDDDLQIRASLTFLFASRGILARAFDGGASFFEHCDKLSAAPIILDIRMPGMSGLDFLDRLSQHSIDWPVIILTGHGEIGVAVQAIKQGAMDFLEKPVKAEELDAVLRQAFTQMSVEQKYRDARESSRNLLAQLTPRETEVLTALCSGKANKQVALDLSISSRTVEMHRSNALNRLGVRTIAEVINLRNAAKLT